MTHAFTPAHALLRRLMACRRAVSVVEFALIAPIMTTMGLGAIEVASMAITYMRVSQIAITIADNASRAKQSSSASGAVMREFDVNEAFAQADKQYPGLNIFTRGKVIMSSLEYNAVTTGQYIHWQRCRGSLSGASKYGVEGTGSITAFAGMGPTGNVLAADSGSAIMFVEVYYQYQPIFFAIGGSPTIYRAAAMYVRDDRDLTGGAGATDGVANPSPAATKYTC